MAGWLVLRSVESRWFSASEPATVVSRNDRARLVTVASLSFALCASAAAAATWAAQGMTGRIDNHPSQLDALRRLSSERRLLAVNLYRRRESIATRCRSGSRCGRSSLRASAAPGAMTGRSFDPGGPSWPSRIRPVVRAPSGWIMAGIGRDQFAIRTLTLEEARASFVVTFPVDVRALIIRGDEDARQNVTGVQIEPLRLVRPQDQLADGVARQGVRYGDTTVWFLDERSFPEREGFWTGGARSTEIVVQPDAPHPAEKLFFAAVRSRTQC